MINWVNIMGGIMGRMYTFLITISQSILKVEVEFSMVLVVKVRHGLHYTHFMLKTKLAVECH